ncbi:MAG: adenine methyltransferase [Actinobacteria bacterium RBG_13_63_9]|nr:MAG: adenine methyltransferase [Actinobacteria bacterium RBG_13_63_9]
MIVPLPPGPFSVIYADPPWSFMAWRSTKDRRFPSRTADSHYPTLTTEEISALPVPSICAPDCALFLWVPSCALPEGLRVIDAWGFAFKTVAFVWVKRNRVNGLLYWGMGHWTRSGAELCLLATRGKPARVGRGVHQVVEAAVREHSRKPDEVRDRIVRLLGDLPRLELFARERAAGFVAWGDEVGVFA